MMETRRSRPTGAIVVAALLFLYVPLVLVVLFSFNSTGSVTLPFDGFSLRWYDEVLNSSEFRSAVETSLLIALATASLTLLIGTAAAYGVSRSKSRLRGPASALLLLPMALPGLFVGAALLSFFDQTGVPLSNLTVLLAHLIYTLPFFVIVVRMGFDRFDPLLEEAASDLGATRWQVFSRVVLPQVWPVLLGASCLMFALSLDEFIITFFVIGPDATLPLFVWSQMRQTIDPSINVVSTVLLTATLLIGLVAMLVVFYGSRRRQRVANA